MIKVLLQINTDRVDVSMYVKYIEQPFFLLIFTHAVYAEALRTPIFNIVFIETRERNMSNR